MEFTCSCEYSCFEGNFLEIYDRCVIIENNPDMPLLCLAKDHVCICKHLTTSLTDQKCLAKEHECVCGIHRINKECKAVKHNCDCAVLGLMCCKAEHGPHECTSPLFGYQKGEENTHCACPECLK